LLTRADAEDKISASILNGVKAREGQGPFEAKGAFVKSIGKFVNDYSILAMARRRRSRGDTPFESMRGDA
jgi:hypothetical protein